jgi:hypothetical protein
MAQQAVPNGIGNKEYFRAQFATVLTVVVRKLSPTFVSVAILIPLLYWCLFGNEKNVLLAFINPDNLHKSLKYRLSFSMGVVKLDRFSGKAFSAVPA